MVVLLLAVAAVAVEDAVVVAVAVVIQAAERSVGALHTTSVMTTSQLWVRLPRPALGLPLVFYLDALCSRMQLQFFRHSIWNVVSLLSVLQHL